MEENLRQISNELYNIAQVPIYDWLILFVSLLSVVVAIVVAFFTYKIYNKQLNLMQEQKTISDDQTKISDKQTEIMEQQNKIALFEKRYEVYKFACDFLFMVVRIEIIFQKQPKDIETKKQIAKILYSLLNISSNDILEKDDISRYILEYSVGIKYEIEKVKFLYGKEIADHFENLLELIMKVFKDTFNENDIQELSLLSQKFSDYGIVAMEKQLYLNKEENSCHLPKQIMKME